MANLLKEVYKITAVKGMKILSLAFDRASMRNLEGTDANQFTLGYFEGYIKCMEQYKIKD